MTYLPIVLVACCLLVEGCGATPTSPTITPLPDISRAAQPPTLAVTVSSPPFRAGIPGEVRYEVSGITSLASLEYASTDGATEFGMIMTPAPAAGTVRIVYTRAGSFTATFTATTADAATLRATLNIAVID